MSRKQAPDFDETRTIADMRDVRPRSLFLPRRMDEDALDETEAAQREARPWEKPGLNREERRWFILGALRAALLIAAAFIVGLGLTVLVIAKVFS